MCARLILLFFIFGQLVFVMYEPCSGIKLLCLNSFFELED